MVPHHAGAASWPCDHLWVRRHLLVLRHAKSAWDDPTVDDHDRPLAPRGEAAGRKVRAYLEGRPERPEVVLCSSAVRTVQTLDAIRPALSERAVVSVEGGLYLADASVWLRRLAALDDEVTCAMVIGHNPGLEDLADALVGAGPAELRDQLAAKFPTAALAKISFKGAWSDLAPGRGRLDAYFQPRHGDP
jgi:phosphohistidine phosphatase